MGEEGHVRRSSQAEVKGQVRLAHLLSVYRIKLIIHGHCEDVLPQTYTTCFGVHETDQTDC